MTCRECSDRGRKGLVLGDRFQGQNGIFLRQCMEESVVFAAAHTALDLLFHSLTEHSNISMRERSSAGSVPLTQVKQPL